jgi:hypothetical protein
MLTFFPCSDFADVVRLVVQRVQELPKHQLLLCWGRAYLEAFHYLSFNRL